MDATRLVVFYEQEHLHQMEKLKALFPISAALVYPIEPENLKEIVAHLSNKHGCNN